ncbi:T9SS type A sorting domain-containing protein [Epilithonimonas xixisoli]|uniref:Putative secreted protein (Por secretion system target) n=1 Tax=Epilithonimonas xixisoli TaxID=1476462 RepID=A0A4R8IGM7_9FLAO|nr:T9SS type A sorting domain-containing protein [Epilithonimonas xixisoli]TDX85955.1 putative secreted protein (Por secretion system target) [Epilithonimonas xixisoli]
MKKKLFLLAGFGFALTAFAQTTYSTTRNGNWDSPEHWVGGVVPPNTINAKDVVNINHITGLISKNLINNGTININAYVPFEGGTKIVNNGKIILLSQNAKLNSNDKGSSITNNYAIDNNGYITHISDFVNNGYIFNQGSIFNFQKLFYDGVTMQCSDWGRLVNNNVLCNNNGNVVSNDCGSTTTGNPSISNCETLKATIMNATLAVGETAKSDGIKMYPNPTTGIFNIGFENNDLSNSKVQIFDMTGKSVISKNTQKSDNTLIVDISSVPKGNYVLKIRTTNGKEITRKMMKK